MIIQRNYLPSALSASVDPTQLHLQVSPVLAALFDGTQADASAPLRVHLDWIPYDGFRDPVTIRQTVDHQSRLLPQSEIAIDLRRLDPQRLSEQLTAAVNAAASPTTPQPDPGVVLDTFRPWRDSLLWSFNQLFWRRLAAWPSAAPGQVETPFDGGLDASHPDAVADSVGDFWTLLRDLDARGQLPAEVYAVEIGVGNGSRARLWLDKLKALDDDCGTGYYARLKFLIGDYSAAALDVALAALGPHAPLASIIAIDATNPIKTLSFLRFKVLFVHLTNVYSNLSFDELVRRDGQLYIVEVRPYLSAAAAGRLGAEFGIEAGDGLQRAIEGLLSRGPEFLGSVERGARFWACLWRSLRMEERLRTLDEGEEAHLPAGVGRAPLDDLLTDAPLDVRFQLSRGAAESFVNTVPLLHPRGYLQVQDMFVPSLRAALRSRLHGQALDSRFRACEEIGLPRSETVPSSRKEFETAFGLRDIALAAHHCDRIESSTAQAALHFNSLTNSFAGMTGSSWGRE